MGKEVFSIYGKLGLDTSEFKNGLTTAKSGIQKLSDGFKSLTGVSLSTAGAIAALGKGLQFSINEAMEAQTSQIKLATVLKSTGGAAGLVQSELMDLATELSHVTMYSEETIQDAESLMLTFTKIGKDVFPSAIQAAMDMSAALGTDLSSSVLQLGKALNDPNGMTALKRVGISFSEAQMDMAKSMYEAGDAAGYQKIIIQELNKEFGGMAQAMGSTYAGQVTIFKNSLGELGESIGTTLLPALQSAVTGLNNIDFNETLQSMDRFWAKIQTFGMGNKAGSAYMKDMLPILLAETDSYEDLNQELRTYATMLNFTVDGYGVFRTANGTAVEGVNLFTEATYNAAKGIKDIPMTAPGGISALGNAAGEATPGMIAAAEAAGRLATQISILGDIDPGFVNELFSAIDKIDFKQLGGTELQNLGENLLAGIDTGKIGLEVGKELATSLAIGLEALKVKAGEMTAEEAANAISESTGMTLAAAQSELDKWIASPHDMKIAVALEVEKLTDSGPLVAETKLDSLMGKVEAMQDATVNPTITADTAAAETNLQNLINKAEEMNNATVNPAITADVSDAVSKIDTVKTKMDMIQDKDVTIRVSTIYTTSGVPVQNGTGVIPQTYYGNLNTPVGAAHGANFTVPPGYPNDSMIMGVTSGEHVEVTPAGKNNPPGGGGVNLYGDTYIEVRQDLAADVLKTMRVRL